MIKKTNGVLFELNDAEKEVTAQILDLAEANLAGVRPLHWASGTPMPRKTSEKLVKGFIDELRRELGLLSGLVAPEPEEDREALRQASALRRKDHHVNANRVLCSYDHCSNVYGVMREEQKGNHPWVDARTSGWKVLHPDADSLHTDLVCSGDHDQHGCLIEGRDPQDCTWWGDDRYEPVMVNGEVCLKPWETHP